MSKKSLSERDICTQFITPAVQRAGWDFSTQVREEVTFMATQANVGIKSIQEFAVPLPPLAEQGRIVAKVDELMALCDQLKVKLVESCRCQERLASTLIESALKAA